MTIGLATSPETKQKTVSLWGLFLAYLKIGFIAFGPAMASEAKKTFVKEKKWITEPEFVDGFALGQLLPGATFVSLAVYIGYLVRGIYGAIVSFVGFLIPPFAIMVALSYVYFTFGTLDALALVFKGLGVVVTALVANAVIDIGQSAIKDRLGVAIAVLSLALMYLYSNIFLIIAVAASLGALLYHRTPVTGQGSIAGSALPRDHRNDAVSWLTLLGLVGVVIYAASLNSLLFQLGSTFFKMAAIVFGNGFTMIPVIQQEIVNNRHWLNVDDFLVGIALGQMTPGPVLITATFVGYKVAAFAGALVATLGMFLPSLLLVIATAEIHQKVKNNRWVKAVFKGIVASFAGIMLVVAIGLAQYAIINIPNAVIAVAAFLILRFTSVPTVWVLVGGTAVYSLVKVLL